MNIKYQISIIFFLLISAVLIGQTQLEVGNQIKVKTKDGNLYQGELIEKNDDNLIINTEELGTITLAKSQINKLIPLYPSGDNKKGYLYDNPNATRNIFAPTGYGLRKGEGYYHNFMMLYNSASYGITNNITLGVGLVPIIIDKSIPFSITPKVSIPAIKDKLNFGVGAIYMNLNTEQVGIAYGVGTFGSRANNFSLGLGWGFVEDEWSERPVVTASGQLRIGKRWGLVTENWFLPTYEYTFEGLRKKNYQGLISYSARFIAHSLSIDFGFINHMDVIEVFPLGIPVIGVIIPFGSPYRYKKVKW